MSAPWGFGWDVLMMSTIGGWRVWAGFRNLCPVLAAAGGIWLRRIRQAGMRTEEEPGQFPRSER
jgi:hypothetical protein